MTLALAFLALGQQAGRPGTLPPMMEFADRTSIVGLTDGIVFAAQYGGLVLPLLRGALSYAHTSDTGLIVNMRTAELSYVGSVDIMDRQIVCPSGVFVRSYRSELAKLGKHSPGLPSGWVHNYDVIVKPPTGDKWEPFTLTYPNKAQETIAPELGSDGKPTGKGLNLSNQTYRVTLAPGAETNTYEWIRIDWPNSRTHWTFSPHASGSMVLRTIGTGAVPQEGDIRLGYLPNRELGTVTFPTQNMTMLTFDYRNGLLATATARGGATVGYTYAVSGGETVLWKVSEPFSKGEPSKDSYVYSYASGMPYPALSQIAVPDGNGWSKSAVEYAQGRLSAVQAASGARQLVGPPQG